MTTIDDLIKDEIIIGKSFQDKFPKEFNHRYMCIYDLFDSYYQDKMDTKQQLFFTLYQTNNKFETYLKENGKL